MMAGHKNAYDCIKAFSETDFTEDLKEFDVPTLFIHGDDDQIVPIDAAARAATKLVKGSTLKVYPGGSHSLMDTERDRLNADPHNFINGRPTVTRLQRTTGTARANRGGKESGHKCRSRG